MASSAENPTYWNETAEAPDFPRLARDLSVDVAIVGGGIVGVTTARLLKDRGLSVALVEARRVGRQVTGKSTAKVTSQHGLTYQALKNKYDEARARLYAEAQEAGVREIMRLATAHRIDADLETLPAYIYTQDERYVGQIEREVEIARRLGLPASLTRDTGLPFDVLAAIRFDDQAQFHPTKYVAGLAATLPGEGCHVFEHSRVLDYTPTSVTTEAAAITARHVVMATHLPLGQVGGFYTMNYPHAEAVVAARIGRVPPGVYKSAEEPNHSIRTHKRANGDVYAIAAGLHFKPGHVDDERRAVDEIGRWLTDNFAAGPIEYRWVNEDYSPMDDVPFIGWSSSIGDAYLVATGFAGWGISKGTAAAMILADLAAGAEHHPWLDLFDARRLRPIAGGKDFVAENAAVASHLVSGYLARRPDSYDALAPGEAAIMKVDGDHVAAFRDAEGQLHAVSAVCSHMGCIVGWNETDRTWDCPCHGSRFALDGEVIHGPATRPLRVCPLGS